MNKFIKYVLIPGLVLGASVGTTYGVTAHFKNQELDKRYQAGYESALSDEAYYKSQLETFQKLVDEQSLKISNFTTQVEQLTKDNEDKALQISSLNLQLSTAKTQLESLETDNELKSGQISTLTSTVSDLQNEIVELQQSGLDKDVLISQLNTQISNLQLQIGTLQTTITLNTQTINALNSQIISYTSQINTLQEEIKNNTTSIKDYTDQISALQKTVAYLESYIDSLVSENQSLVRFMYNGSVYNMQIVNNGSTAMVTDPEETNYIKFNYWMINNIEVDPSEYVITEETEFVANVTYYYDVKFMNVDTAVSSQIVVENGTATVPEAPSRSGYSFLGWSIDGVTTVDPTTVTITEDITFIALWADPSTMYDTVISNLSDKISSYYAISSIKDITLNENENSWEIVALGYIVSTQSEQYFTLTGTNAIKNDIVRLSNSIEDYFSTDDEGEFITSLNVLINNTPNINYVRYSCSSSIDTNFTRSEIYDYLLENGSGYIDISLLQTNMTNDDNSNVDVIFTSSYIEGIWTGIFEIEYNSYKYDLIFKITNNGYNRTKVLGFIVDYIRNGTVENDLHLDSIECITPNDVIYIFDSLNATNE